VSSQSVSTNLPRQPGNFHEDVATKTPFAERSATTFLIRSRSNGIAEENRHGLDRYKTVIAASPRFDIMSSVADDPGWTQATVNL